jgi:ribosomal protein S18 acetylase RimI-like enzyme
MVIIFDISEAQPADAVAIASLFAHSWTSPFTRLQFGQVDPVQLATSMVPRIAEQMVKMNSKFIVARHVERQEIAAVAHWTMPDDTDVDAVVEEADQDTVERQQFEDEVFRRSLPDRSNKALVMEFTIGLRQLREQTLQGRRHILLENLATHLQYRGMGLASRLVGWASVLADDSQLLVYLDTASDNPAARLYERLGFEEQGRHTIEDLRKFAAAEDIENLGCDIKHTHVAFLRFPKNSSNVGS